MKKTSTDTKAPSSRRLRLMKPRSSRPRKSSTCLADYEGTSTATFLLDSGVQVTLEIYRISLSKRDMSRLEQLTNLSSQLGSVITPRLTFRATCSASLSSMQLLGANSNSATGKKPRRRVRTTSSKLSKPNLKAGSHTFPMTRPYRALRFGILEQPKAETA